MVLENLGKMQPDFKLNEPGILRESIQPKVINLNSKVLHLNFEVVHSSQNFHIDDPDLCEKVIDDANTHDIAHDNYDADPFFMESNLGHGHRNIVVFASDNSNVFEARDLYFVHPLLTIV